MPLNGLFSAQEPGDTHTNQFSGKTQWRHPNCKLKRLDRPTDAPAFSVEVKKRIS